MALGIPISYILILMSSVASANLCGPITVDCQRYTISFKYESFGRGKNVNEAIACGKGNARGQMKSKGGNGAGGGAVTWGGNDGSIGPVQKGHLWKGNSASYGKPSFEYIPIVGIPGNGYGEAGTTSGGLPVSVAIHVGENRGGPNSNGCVRVSQAVMDLLKTCPHAKLQIINAPQFTGSILGHQPRSRNQQAFILNDEFVDPKLRLNNLYQSPFNATGTPNLPVQRGGAR